MVTIRPKVNELLPWLTELRRSLHQCPEIMYQEEQTSNLAAATLAGAGLKVWRGFGRTGLAAIWDSGRPGPTLAFRADMDGLDISEPEGLAFASRNPGFMHACGHDFHLALGLGMARLAAAGGLADTAGGRLMIICQPAEEGGGGAKAMLDDGLFETVAKPDYIFAGHAEPALPPGRLSITPGPVMAGVLDFEYLIRGRGGHAACPEAAINPIPAAAGLATALTAWHPTAESLISATIISGGHRTNVIPPEARLAGTLRYHTAAARRTGLEFLTEIGAKVDAAGPARVSLRFYDGYPPTVNDRGLAELARRVAEPWLAPGMLLNLAPSFGGEDFSYFLERTPGAFIHIGTGGPGHDAPLHSPDFNINEEALPIGLEFWARLAERILSDQPL